jgi:hypothetical protein
MDTIKPSKNCWKYGLEASSSHNQVNGEQVYHDIVYTFLALSNHKDSGVCSMDRFVENFIAYQHNIGDTQKKVQI